MIMKKLLVLALAGMLVFNIAGCSGKAKEEVKEEVTKEVEEVEEEMEEAEVEAAEEAAEVEEAEIATGESAMDAYIAESQEMLDAVAESIKDMMELTVKAEGNTLIYTYQYVIDLGDNEEAKAQLEEQMSLQEATMQASIQEMEAAGIENPVCVIEYLDQDGELITSFEFK